MKRPGRLVLATAAALACGDAGSPGATTAGVAIVYAAPTAADPQIAALYPTCFQQVSQTHIHASWLDYQAYFLTPEAPDRWTITYPDVPVGREHRIRVNDPNRCDLNATGAVTTGITANGVLLTRVADTPGSGTEPGLAFTVDADGTVR